MSVGPTISITDPRPGEAKLLAKIWHESWHLTHSKIVDPGLVAARDVKAFDSRIASSWNEMLVGRLDDEPVGFASIKPGQLHQCFVGSGGRGTGIAAQLMQAAEQRLVATGSDEAFLHCVVGNERAIAFYKNLGWRETGETITTIHAGGKVFKARCIVFRKRLV